MRIYLFERTSGRDLAMDGLRAARSSLRLGSPLALGRCRLLRLREELFSRLAHYESANPSWSQFPLGTTMPMAIGQERNSARSLVRPPLRLTKIGEDRKPTVQT